MMQYQYCSSSASDDGAISHRPRNDQAMLCQTKRSAEAVSAGGLLKKLKMAYEEFLDVEGGSVIASSKNTSPLCGSSPPTSKPLKDETLQMIMFHGLSEKEDDDCWVDELFRLADHHDGSTTTQRASFAGVNDPISLIGFSLEAVDTAEEDLNTFLRHHHPSS